MCRIGMKKYKINNSCYYTKNKKNRFHFRKYKAIKTDLNLKFMKLANKKIVFRRKEYKLPSIKSLTRL